MLPAPQILPPLLQALGKEDADLKRVADLISFDPALTARLLGFCNSAFFGLSTRIDSVPEAVHQLGFRTVYRIVAGTVGGRLLTPSQRDADNFPGSWWKHAVLTAFAAQFVADDIGAEPGAMFTAGLLHELGRVVLLQAFKGDYARLLEKEPGLTKSEVAEREMNAFGVTHAETGGRLLARWQFDAPIVSGVRFHNDPASASDETEQRFAACVHLSDELALSADPVNGEQVLAQAEPPISMAMLNLSPKNLSRYEGLITENMKFAEAMCQLN